MMTMSLLSFLKSHNSVLIVKKYHTNINNYSIKDTRQFKKCNEWGVLGSGVPPLNLASTNIVSLL